MDMNNPSQRSAFDETAESKRISASVITVIPSHQLPEAIRPAFLPEDIVLLCEHRRNGSNRHQTRAQTLREPSLIRPECMWCKPANVYATMMMIQVLVYLIGGILLGKVGFCGSIQKTLVGIGTLLVFLTQIRFCIHERRMANAISNGRRRRDVELDCISNLVHRMISPMSLLLLKRSVIVNARSFIRYYKFFNKEENGEGFDKKVDSCIRFFAAEGQLCRTQLVEDGHILLGLAPCQNIINRAGWGSSWLNALYRHYRNWQRWRLAALMLERVHLRNRALLQRDVKNEDHDCLILPERLRDNRAHKWFMMNSHIFGRYRLRRRLGGAQQSNRGGLIDTSVL